MTEDAPVWTYRPPEAKGLPILISVPHSGTLIPAAIRDHMVAERCVHPEDTDWFVDQLYDWASSVGIGIIKANYSRYVIDLNRDPGGSKLYSDSRTETQLIPTRTFAGEPLLQETSPLTPEQQTVRLDQYYWPYHSMIETKLRELRGTYAHVLLFDAHSIKRQVSSIHPDAFPDIIFGNQDGKTCSSDLFEIAVEAMAESYQVTRNTPFKGGQITRSFGQPRAGVHALQLEMSQDLYMDEARTVFDDDKSLPLKDRLKEMLLALAEELLRLDR